MSLLFLTFTRYFCIVSEDNLFSITRTLKYFKYFIPKGLLSHYFWRLKKILRSFLALKIYSCIKL